MYRSQYFKGLRVWQLIVNIECVRVLIMVRGLQEADEVSHVKTIFFTTEERKRER